MRPVRGPQAIAFHGRIAGNSRMLQHGVQHRGLSPRRVRHQRKQKGFGGQDKSWMDLLTIPLLAKAARSDIFASKRVALTVPSETSIAEAISA
jgi:hypothetical protein